MGMLVGRYALGMGAAAAFLAGCGGAQPSAMPLSTAYAQKSPARNATRGKSVLEFVYVANLYSDNVSAYAVNASGALTPVQGSPFAAGYDPYGVAIDPTGKFAFVVNNGTGSGKEEGNVSAFAINPSSGALTPVEGSPFTAGANPLAVAISRNGKFAYVVNYNSANVSIFAINARTGGLKQVKSLSIGRPSPTLIAIDPTGQFAYLTHWGYHPDYHDGHIVGYAMNMRRGALRKVKSSGKDTGFEPVSAAIDPSSKFLYVANYLSSTISAYAINARNGALSEVQGSPFFTGYNPGAVTVDPNGPFVYVPFDLGVGAYTIGFNGTLTQVPGSPFQAGYEPDGAAVDPLGKFVYVSSTGEYGKVSAYTINPSNGALTQVQGSPFAAGTNPAGIATCEIERHRCVPATL